MSKYKDLVTGICGMIFSAALFLLSIPIGMKENTSIGADFLPKIVAVMLFILFGALTMRGAAQVKSGEEGEKPSYALNYRGVVILFIAMIVYAALLKPLGFVISSMLFLALAIVMMTKKEELKPVMVVVITVASVLVIYFLFREVFGIRLPKGIL